MPEPQGTRLTQQIPTPWEQRRRCQQRKRSQRRKCPWAEIYNVRGGRSCYNHTYRRLQQTSYTTESLQGMVAPPGLAAAKWTTHVAALATVRSSYVSVT